MSTLKHFCLVLLLCASLLVLNAATVLAEMPVDLAETIQDYLSKPRFAMTLVHWIVL